MADNYDAIVIGAGNGGLSAAAALACAGKKTLLLERHNLPGGSATSFVRGRFEFETALHELCDLGDADQPGTVWKIFAGYGINQVDWQREDRLFRLLVPGEIDLVLPTGEEAFCDAMEQAVPGCRPAVAALLALGKKATQAQAVVMGQHPGPEELMAQYSDFLKMASSTTREGMDALGMPERAANILETYWCYLGGDADQLDFLTTAEMIWKYVALQPAQPDQKSHGLSLAMAKVIYDHGGEIWLNTAADEILVENGKVTGVRCGKRILHTKHVVADCSPSTVIGALLPKDAPVPARPRRLLNARRYAKCLATMYVGLNRSAEELGIRDYSTLIMSDLDTSLQAKKANTREKGVFIANCLNVMIPESSPSGTCTLFFTSFDDPADWEGITPAQYYRKKQEMERDWIQHYEETTGIRIAPYVEEISMATPVTFARYLGTPQGTPYGYQVEAWDNIISRFLAMDQEQILPGLRVTGAACENIDGYNCCYANGLLQAQRTIADIAGEEKRA